MFKDSDTDSTHRLLCSLSNNWATYVLTVKTIEDLKLLKGKKFLTNLRSSPGQWVFREFTEKQIDSIANSGIFDDWKDTQVMFVGDLARAAGFPMDNVR